MGRPRKQPEQTSPTLYEGADGSWHARVTVGRHPDGTPQRKHVQRRTKAEARTAVRELERLRDAGRQVWTHEDITLAQWLEHWLDAILPMTARWKTLSTYRSAVRVHVNPALGAWRLPELRPEHFEEHYRAMGLQGHSTHVVRGVHRVLRSALNEAVRRRRLTHNPLLVARPPRVEEIEVEPLTVEECRRVLAVAQAGPHPARWSIALSLGLRQGETLGLLWSDVDLGEGVLRVRRSVQRHTWSHGCPQIGEQPSCGHVRGAECGQRHDGGLLLVEPKTKASKRTIVLAQPLIDELRAHRIALRRRRLSSGSDWDGTHDLVFPGPKGGLIDPARDNTEWNRI